MKKMRNKKNKSVVAKKGLKRHLRKSAVEKRKVDRKRQLKDSRKKAELQQRQMLEKILSSRFSG
jgi:hypothetical protein